MLKLTSNTGNDIIWSIDWNNTIFKVKWIIWAIDSVSISGNILSKDSYKFSQDTITLETAPQSWDTISVDFYKREINQVSWNWEVTLWRIVDKFYRTIWRVNPNWIIPQNILKIFPKDYVTESLRLSYKKIHNSWPETVRQQQYSFLRQWGFDSFGITENVSDSDRLSDDILGIFMISDWVMYDYYWIENWRFVTSQWNISKTWDKVIIWNKIPQWVKKVISVIVEWVEYDNVNEEDFNIFCNCSYTIVSDFQWQEYILLPYTNEAKRVVVKIIPDYTFFSHEDDIVNIPEEYIDVIVYDTAIKLLMEKEDERWADFQRLLWDWRSGWLLSEYRSFIKSRVKKPKWKIKIPNNYF